MVRGRLIGNSGSGNAAGEVIEVRGGHLTTSQTWYANPLIYRVNQRRHSPLVGVQQSRRPGVLTIGPGTTIEFANNCGVAVGYSGYYYAAFVCDGTAGSPVTLTAVTKAPGSWTGVYYTATTISAQSRMDYTRVEYAGQTNGANVLCESASPILSNCTFAGSSVNGVRCSGAVTPVIQNCTSSGNLQDGLDLQSNSSTVTSCRFTGNGRYGLWADTGCSAAHITNCIGDGNVSYPFSLAANSVRAMESGNTGSGNTAGDVIEVRADHVTTSQTWVPNPLIYE